MKYLYTFLLPLLFLVVSCKEDIQPMEKEPPAPADFKNTGDWAKSEDGILGFRIGSDKKVYEKDDDVFVLLEIHNYSDKNVIVGPLSLHPPLGTHESLSFEGPGGTIQYIGVIPQKSMIPPQPILLDPKQSCIIRDTFIASDFKDISTSGDYSMKYRYISFDPSETQPDCWKGEILSETITFTRK